ncbi:hypothetical protein QE152_g37621 [Popillia japonica]|uniref:Uncharacterized protein n=1 Tax=Popillia japonica TaxID=7064 RepID=A0AAW1IA16_POPJA
MIVYLNEHFQDRKAFKRTLPRQKGFYDIISDSHISDEDYSRGKKVWEVFECTKLGEDLRMENYKLDLTHCVIAPGLSWDAMLRMTDVKLELLTDLNMLHFFKMGIRDGVMEEMNSIDIASIPDESDIGYVFKVDLEYPQHLHDTHNDFPFCPDNKITPTSK